LKLVASKIEFLEVPLKKGFIMKKREILFLICCLSAVAVSMEPKPASDEEWARLEKIEKAQEAYFEKHGESKEMTLPVSAKVENPTPIDVGSLKKTSPEEIAEMQIYRIEWVDQKPVKRYLSIPFGKDSRQEIEAVMKLIKKAPKWTPSGLEMNDPDRALVIRLTDGNAFEILYNSHLKHPFAGLDLRKLKEALYGLSCNSNKIAIMQIKGDKTIDVTHMSAQSVQRSGHSSNGIVTVALKLNGKGDLVLNLKIKDSSRNQILVDGQKAIQYGGAVVCDALAGDDTFVAYLFEPTNP
jgi:hypothetical protein